MVLLWYYYENNYLQPLFLSIYIGETRASCHAGKFSQALDLNNCEVLSQKPSYTNTYFFYFFNSDTFWGNTFYFLQLIIFFLHYSFNLAEKTVFKGLCL